MYYSFIYFLFKTLPRRIFRAIKFLINLKTLTLANKTKQFIKQQQTINESNPINNNQLVKCIGSSERTTTSGLILPTIQNIHTSEPILAVSNDYVLINERTRKRNQIIVYDEYLNYRSLKFPRKITIIETVHFSENKFLLLTETQLFIIDAKIMSSIEVIEEIIPYENAKIFKSCTYNINDNSLFLSYATWGGEIERWKQQPNWKLVNQYMPTQTTMTEYEYISNIKMNNNQLLAMTIYNSVIDQWHLEIRAIETLNKLKTILLPRSDFDYCLSLMNYDRWLIYNKYSNDFLLVDQYGKKQTGNYGQPIKNIALFRYNNLIVRTMEKLRIIIIADEE
ncbi:unnamed protein product [Didymodactylos carnosus]|uniref:Uncharacterized protein n=1 Tax=Didymodactylos carnosus TaxID=1234261 RepID=A0A813WQP4_9BILA|nr:unnamed protein product [Didymodactylos carnosus]CAF1421587.1 unnamed protein product [Didymodactylos carnosus]CAF3644906.1 unnamed protein product [Didymodactylos carnosus]CAF4222088.1 unnamed protein product [Didymodactylos carnosus]